MGDEGFALIGGDGWLVRVFVWLYSYLVLRDWERGDAYFFEQVLDGCFGLLFVFGGLWRYRGRLGKLGVFVEVAFCLYISLVYG